MQISLNIASAIRCCIAEEFFVQGEAKRASILPHFRSNVGIFTHLTHVATQHERHGGDVQYGVFLLNKFVEWSV
jgi:hypothetical protein